MAMVGKPASNSRKKIKRKQGNDEIIKRVHTALERSYQENLEIKPDHTWINDSGTIQQVANLS